MQSEIVEAFGRIKRDTPARPLIYLPATGEVLSVTDVDELAAQIDRALEGARVSRRAVVAGIIGNRAAAVSMLLACRNRGTRTSRSTWARRQSRSRRSRGSSASPPLSSPHAQTIDGFTRLEPFVSGLTLAIADTAPDDSRFGDAVVLKMTSGSTGMPRATLTSEAVLVTDSRTLMQAMEIGPDDILVAAIPLSHAYGLGNLLVPALIQGSALVLRDTFVPHRLPDDVRMVGRARVSRRAVHVRSLRGATRRSAAGRRR